MAKWNWQDEIAELRADRDQWKAAAEAAYAELKRVRLLVPRPEQTDDEILWRDHKRGIPLAALAKEFGVSKERMRWRLQKIEQSLNALEDTGRTG